jgi:4-carboxymuconolactone decarboxylase
MTETDGGEPSGAERMFGDFAAALVGFTDNVLFGEVWERTELSRKERSLVTVAALTAMGKHRPAAVPPRLRQDQRRPRSRADRSDHPPRVLGRLAQTAIAAMAVAKEIFRPHKTPGNEGD